MDKKSLEKNLANLERELLALQTAHDVGLGVVDFYEITMTGTMQQMQGQGYYYVYILVWVKDGERFNPFVQYWQEREEQGFVDSSYELLKNDEGNHFLISFIGFVPSTISAKMVSTSQLDWRVSYDTQEAMAWVDWEA